jgi:hypothetical protein
MSTGRAPGATPRVVPDVVATTLADTLKNHGAHCTTLCWPQHADYTSNKEQLGIICVPVDSPMC